MGNSQISSKDAGSMPGNQIQNRIRFIHSEIDKFYSTQLTKHQFIHQLFSDMQKSNTQQFGRLNVCNTYILERLYTTLTKNTGRETVNCAKLKQLVDKICKDPDAALQKSFQLLDLNGQKVITNAEFLNYMDNCFISLLSAAEKDITDNNFRLAFREYMMKNKKKFFGFVLQIFQKHKRSDPNVWNCADYKRWVLTGQNWTLDIQVGPKIYRMPLNLLCLFSIPSKS